MDTASMRNEERGEGRPGHGVAAWPRVRGAGLRLAGGRGSMLAVLFRFLFLGLGLGLAPGAEAAEPIRVQLKWYHQFQFAGYYAAEQKGFYAEEGLRVEILEGGKGKNPLAIVLEGGADFGVGDSDVLLARLRGQPLVACAAIFQHSPYVLLSRKDRNIRTPSDLLGRTVMMADDQGEAQFRAMLVREGVSPAQVAVIPHSWDLKDLVEGRVDAISAYAMVEPDLLRGQGVEPAMLRALDYGVDFYGDTLFARESVVEGRRREAAAFVRATLRGWDYAMDHPEEVAEMVLQFGSVRERGLTRELILRQAEGMRPYIMADVVPVGHMNPGRWKHIADTFAEHGMIGRADGLDGFLFEASPGPDPRLQRTLLILGLGSLLVTVLVLSWNAQIRREVRVRTRELSAEVARRRETEEGLAREEEFTRALLEGLDAGVVACDAEGRITLLNRVARLWFGVGPVEDASGCGGGELRVYGADGGRRLEAEKAPWKRAGRGEVVRGERMVVESAEGARRHVIANASVVSGRDGRQLAAVVVMHDLTERLEAEAKLELQSAALRAAVNAIVITDTAGRIVFVNPAFTRLTGYSTEEVVGKTPALLKSGVHDRDFYERMWRTIRGGDFWHGEITNRRKDGTLFEEEMTITPVLGVEGGITHYVAIKQEITERKAMEKQLLRSQRLESVGLLAGGIAHDVNNVLAPVLMSVELLRTGGIPAHLQEVVDDVERSAKRGAEIVRQILTFARGAEGDRGPVSLRHLIGEMVRMAVGTFPRVIEVRERVTKGLWMVRGDATQLHQVLLNLSVNARDAMVSGGVLTFGASNVVLDDAAVQGQPGLKAGPHVRIEVRDTGIGIPPGILDRIFEPFFSSKPHGKGTGLGLSTVLGIVRDHGGAITVASVPGQGSCFTVLLPAVGADESAQVEPERSLTRGRGQLVLLVDDESSILRVGETVLKRFGYRVTTASNGREALDLLDRHGKEVEVVVSDLMMPGMSGLELLAEIRRRRPGLPCVAASGLMGANDADRAEQLRIIGVSRFLTKPYAVESILAVLEESLREGGERSDAADADGGLGMRAGGPAVPVSAPALQG